ncbi:unnamed protein product [Effrenium voratum]|uniref:PDZ domain-containing protein n=1 Tax=Effrenium voratum TaxID=2562239 RepID=A0AA36I4N0_9DINO|nr:unnamed protein product [Effrenium voratum]
MGPGLRLAFRNLYPVKSRQTQCYGAAGSKKWRSIEIPGNYCEFEFSSDGDGMGFPEQRWGFWALISAKPPDLETPKDQDTNFTLEVEKKEGGFLGITTTEAGGSCIVTGLEPGDTPVQAWNAAHPDKALKVHDCIVQVNGVKASYEAILDELRKFQKHEIVAKRMKRPTCSLSHPLQPDPRVFNTCDVCGVSGTEFRCPSGCDYDMCMSCFQSLTSGPVHCPLEDMNAFADKRVKVVCRAEGNQDDPEVERDSWDEQRLRALCARHGWDFEWMTEDGERQRRADERFSEWKLEESMASFLHEDSETPDAQQLDPVQEEPAPPVLQRINS